MNFAGITCLYFFLPVVLAGYFLLPRRARNAWLLAASAGFYLWAQPVALFWKAALAAAAFAAGRVIERARAGKMAGEEAPDAKRPEGAAEKEKSAKRGTEKQGQEGLAGAAARRLRAAEERKAAACASAKPGAAAGVRREGAGEGPTNGTPEAVSAAGKRGIGDGAGQALERPAGARRRSRIFWLAAAVQLGVLFLYKYEAALARAVQAAFGWGLPVFAAATPVGLSFAVFQNLSYLAEVRRGAAAERRFGRYLLYGVLFLNGTAGPIFRYGEAAAQIAARRESIADAAAGFTRMAIGLAKKVILSGAMGGFTADFLAAGEYSALYSWGYALAVSLQVYFDFSGYSDMAIGLGQVLGFRLPENFRYPFCARSAGEFWRRWHESLGAWFRDYIYIPLGGSRCGKRRMVAAILCVWAATGLWHGVSANYLAWGMLFGGVICLEKLGGERILRRIPRAAQWGLTAGLVLISFVIFAGDSLAASAQVLRGMMAGGALGPAGRQAFANYGGSLLLAAAAAFPWGAQAVRALEKRPGFRQAIGLLRPLWAAALLLLSTAWLVDGSFQAFLYFRF